MSSGQSRLVLAVLTLLAIAVAGNNQVPTYLRGVEFSREYFLLVFFLVLEMIFTVVEKVCIIDSEIEEKIRFFLVFLTVSDFSDSI